MPETLRVGEVSFTKRSCGDVSEAKGAGGATARYEPPLAEPRVATAPRGPQSETARSTRRNDIAWISEFSFHCSRSCPHVPLPHLLHKPTGMVPPHPPASTCQRMRSCRDSAEGSRAAALAAACASSGPAPKTATATAAETGTEPGPAATGGPAGAATAAADGVTDVASSSPERDWRGAGVRTCGTNRTYRPGNHVARTTNGRVVKGHLLGYGTVQAVMAAWQS